MSETNTKKTTASNNLETNDAVWPEDKPLRHRVKKQNFVVLSILKLKSGKLLFRTRGTYEEYNDAILRVNELKKIDDVSFIFACEMGKWLAIYYDLEKMKTNTSNERNDLLNGYMKCYKECLVEEEQEEKKRKDDLLKGANVVTGKHKETIDSESSNVVLEETKNTEDTDDYLDEDKPLRHVVKSQDYFNCSILNLQSFPEGKRDRVSNMQVWGLKIRGVFDEYKEASDKAEYTQKMDKYHNVFVGEVGKNYPADVDVSEMGSEDQVYREKSLGKYMKSTNGANHEEEETHTEPSVVSEPSTSTTKATPVAQEVRTFEDNADKEIEKNNVEKQKLQTQLEESKSTLAGLEDKLSKINELYAKLKSE
jgi:hypothetical protein